MVRVPRREMREKENELKVVRNSERCYGCRACEIVCSYHHLRAFSPGGGSIRVDKDHGTGKIAWSIHSTCDFCTGEQSPLCVRYCSYEALSIRER